MKSPLLIYLLFCGLFNDAVSSLDYHIALNDKTLSHIAVYGPRFEPETSQIRSRHGNHSAATIGISIVQGLSVVCVYSAHLVDDM
jgi:hypothetical protein